MDAMQNGKGAQLARESAGMFVGPMLVRIPNVEVVRETSVSNSDITDRYVIERRKIPRDWQVVSERHFTGNADDPETRMAPRRLDQCWEYMGHRKGRRRVVPA